MLIDSQTPRPIILPIPFDQRCKYRKTSFETQTTTFMQCHISLNQDHCSSPARDPIPRSRGCVCIWFWLVAGDMLVTLGLTAAAAAACMLYDVCCICYSDGSGVRDTGHQRLIRHRSSGARAFSTQYRHDAFSGCHGHQWRHRNVQVPAHSSAVVLATDRLE